MENMVKMLPKYQGPQNMPFSPNNPYQLNNIELLVNTINNNTKVIKVENTKGENGRNICVLTLRCSCGNEFKINRTSIRLNQSKLNCIKCTNKINAQKKSLDKLEDKINFINNKGYKILSDTSYIRNQDKILLKNKDGYIGYSTYRRIKENYEPLFFSNKHNKEYFIYNLNIFCRNNYIKTQVIGYADEQNWTDTGIKCICACGRRFEIPYTSLKNKTRTRCDVCSTGHQLSRWCMAVEQFLNANHISYKKEVKFSDCKDKLPLPFDYQIDAGLIEVDGEQHENLNNYHFCGSYEENVESFYKQKYHDKLKDNYCKQHNIKLLRISYKDVLDNSYKQKILKFVNSNYAILEIFNF